MYKLIEKTTRRGQLKPIAAPLKKSITPDITISRDPGSGGKLIAQKVATRMGWKFFDKTLLIKLANELGIPPREFADVDEHSRSWLADSFHSLLNPNYVSDVRYIAHLKRILLHANQDTDFVVLGRGANHILDPHLCLRVRITASFSKRVSNTVKFEGKTREEAAKWVEHIESKRVNFIKQYFSVNPYNPWHYDLVINTDTLTLNQAAEIVIQAYLAKFPGEKKRLAKRLS